MKRHILSTLVRSRYKSSIGPKFLYWPRECAFPAGLLLYGFHRLTRRRGSLSAIVIVALAIGLLFMPRSTLHQPAVDLLIALVALPAIV